jgi:hypothetical protein
VCLREASKAHFSLFRWIRRRRPCLEVEGTFHAVAQEFQEEEAWNSRSQGLLFRVELPLPRADNDFRAVDYFAAVTEKTLGFPATSVKR